MLIIVQVKLTDGADIQKVMEEVDYEFKHKDIISTEIRDIGLSSNDPCIQS